MLTTSVTFYDTNRVSNLPISLLQAITFLLLLCFWIGIALYMERVIAKPLSGANPAKDS
jgi:hypothetical protein